MNKFKYLNYEFSIEKTSFCKFSACDFILTCKSTLDEKNIINGLLNIVIEPVKEFSNHMPINVNIKDTLEKQIKPRDKNDQEILLCRSIDRILRTLLQTTKDIKITLNIQILRNYNGNKRLFCLIGSMIAIKYLFNIAVGVFCDDNIIIAANNKEIFAIEFESQLISYEETYTKIMQCVEKCVSLIDHLKHIKSESELPKMKKPLIKYNGEDVYLFQKEHKLNTSELIYVTNSFFVKNKTRIDKTRGLHDIRPISYKEINQDIIFERGDTVVLSYIKNSNNNDDNTEENITSNYFFHAFATGESQVKSTTRREIGHANLIRKAFQYTLNPKFKIRANAHVLSSNGSSSMASVCAHSISFQRKGLLSYPIYGIAIGGFTKNKILYFLVDITALEDSISFMDCKICGSINGICAIQMDSKSSLRLDKLKQLLQLSKKSIKKIHESIGLINSQGNKIDIYEISKSKMGLIIGTNGDHINLLRSYTNCKINNTQSGAFFVQGENSNLCKYVFNFINQDYTDKTKISFILKEDTEYKEKYTCFLTVHGIWKSKTKLCFNKNDFITATIIDINNKIIKIFPEQCKIFSLI